MKRIITVILVISVLLLTSCGAHGVSQNANLPDDEYFDTLSELTTRQAKELENNPHALSENYGGSYLDMENEKVVICLVGVDELPEDSTDGVVTYRKIDFKNETLTTVREEIIPQFMEEHPGIIIEIYTQDYFVRVGIRNAEGPDAELIRQFVNERLRITGDVCPVIIHEYQDKILIEE